MTVTPVPNDAVPVMGWAGWVCRVCDGTGARGGAAGVVVRPDELLLEVLDAVVGAVVTDVGGWGVAVVGVAAGVTPEADVAIVAAGGIVAGVASSELELHAASGVSSARTSSPFADRQRSARTAQRVHVTEPLDHGEQQEPRVGHEEQGVDAEEERADTEQREGDAQEAVVRRDDEQRPQR